MSPPRPTMREARPVERAAIERCHEAHRLGILMPDEAKFVRSLEGQRTLMGGQRLTDAQARWVMDIETKLTAHARKHRGSTEAFGTPRMFNGAKGASGGAA